MELMDLMRYQSFAILGSTSNKEKTAYQIKEVLTKIGKKVYCVKEEYDSLNDIDTDVDVLDICMNPKISILYLENLKKKFKGAIIQPGAESEIVEQKLKELGIPYIHGCALIGASRLKNN